MGIIREDMYVFHGSRKINPVYTVLLSTDLYPQVFRVAE
jgi:hypothetical protein